MAKPRGERTTAVYEYLDAHPNAKPVEIVAAMAERGIEITRFQVSAIKTRLKKAGTPKKRSKRAVTPATEAPAPVATLAKPNGTITLEQIKKVAATVKAMGGFERMTEVLDVIRELGGVKKFKDLAEAIACPEADVVVIESDVVPF